MRPLLLLLLCLFLSRTASAQFHMFKSKKQDSTAVASPGTTGFGAKPVKYTPYAKRRKHTVMPLKSFYVLTGKVKGSKPVFLWLAIRDSVMKGTAKYEDSADSLRLFGTIEPDGRMVFCGFSSDGNMLGCFSGKIFDDTAFQGKWFAVANDSSTNDSAWNCVLYRKDTIPSGIDTSLTATRVEGTYSYHMGDTGPAGGIILKKEGRSIVSIDLGSEGGPPDYNSAMIKSAEVPFDGQVAVYTPQEATNPRIRIRIYKDFVVINLLNKKNQGGGYACSVEGVFARIK